jgi:murein L,D-transpeptidase YafK
MKFKIIIFLLCFLFGLIWLLKNKKEQPVNGKVDKVLVDKSKREMYLIRNGRIIKTYSIALGDHPMGDKTMQGDEKTPEGIYLLDWRNSKSTCYKSIHISYPNAADIKTAERLGVSPGGDIMIHGLHPANQYLGKWHTGTDWTDGCIAVTNQEMDEIWNCVKYGTPIEIRARVSDFPK